MEKNNFYREKVVLVTGHMGFKGTWLCRMLTLLGAKVIGYGRENDTLPSLFCLSGMEPEITSIRGDVRDLGHLKTVFDTYRPQMVFHLAAQPIVRESYKEPVYTYETNIMGTVNVLECVRLTGSVKSVVNVTTDKVYHNREWDRGYEETDELNGQDPYSNSKSCSELVTSSYIRSFLEEQGVAVSTVRAGNVLGGGDFSPDRILPDCIRAAMEGRTIEVRSPNSVRPYQHVLEALSVYLKVGEKQYEEKEFAGAYNVGPEQEDCLSTADLTERFCKCWGEGANWKAVRENGPREANYLRLDCRKLKEALGWKPIWGIDKTLEAVVEWSKGYAAGKSVPWMMEEQIREFLCGSSDFPYQP